MRRLWTTQRSTKGPIFTKSFLSARYFCSQCPSPPVRLKDERVKNLFSSDFQVSRPIHRDDQYTNPWNEWKNRVKPTNHEKIKFVLGMMLHKRTHVPPEKVLNKELPIVSPCMDIIKKAPPLDQVVVTWMGHSTFLIQVNGKWILTDPIWSDRCSPVQFSGPKRYRKTPMKLKDLPPIDFVCITHNHYDHLDYYVTQNLPTQTVWIVPEGLKSWFLQHDVKNVVELNWWDQFQYDKDTSIVLTPCQHWSKRKIFGDTNKSLWGSFFITSSKNGNPEIKIYFSGDTGYCDAFRETRRHLGSPDLALIPIGAYAPQVVMQAQHLNPKEAVIVHKELDSTFSIGMHWGTFVLSPEPVFEPREKLREEVALANLDPNSFVTLNIGETRVIPTKLTAKKKIPDRI